MPVVYREDESPAWGALAIVLVVLVFALLIGYFAFWQPRVTADDASDRTTIIQPAQPTPAPSNPTVIPIPVPGPSGAPGPAGPAGPAGPSGPAGQSAPAPEAPAAPAVPETPSTTTTPGTE